MEQAHGSAERRTLGRRIYWGALLLGLFWTTRGYESYDGDQAYRLPLLFARQDPALCAHDPFVAALGEFNPHAGWLNVLDLASRPLGLAAGMVGLYVLVFAAVGWSASRIARALMPSVRGAGLLAFVFFLCARAGNIGTNHLFDSMLLDRQVALAAGWVVLARWACAKGRLQAAEWLCAAVGLAFASWIHPGLGLQLCGLFGVMHLVWGCLERREVGAWTRALGGLTACCVGACPALLFAWHSSGRLLGGVDAEVFRALAVEIQGPQHLAPWLWRTDQWAAAAAYLVLAWFGIADAVRMRHECTEVAWRRIVALFVCGVILLACGWFGVAVMRDLRLTLFQPFRLATVLRGVALLLVAPSFARLWTTRGPWERLRVAALACGLGFDQALLVVVAAELAARAWLHASVRWARVVWLIVILCGLVHLSAHDPQGSGGVLAAVLAVVGAGERVIRRAGILWNARRRALVIASSWAVPALALCGGLAAIGAGETPEWARSAVERCRFFETPFDDMERLGAWARRNLPEDAVLVGPPESKTLRLWSRRAVSFNRAGSPYHGRALLVWGERFRRHVAFAGDTRELARAYQRDRARLEARYYELSCEELSILLDEMNASHVVTHSQREDELARGGIERLHVEGRYAIYVRRARVLASR